MIVMILTVSLTVPYLGAERFGVWMTVASLAAMLSFLDLGVGHALTNRVASTAVHADQEGLRRTISGGLGFLFFVALSCGLALTGLLYFVPWQYLISESLRPMQVEISQAIQVFALLFSANLFASGVTRVFYGLQRGFEAHVSLAIGSLLSLGLLWFAAKDEAGIPVLLACSMAGPIVGGLVLLFVLARRRQFGVRIAVENTFVESRLLIGAGGYFFLLQLTTMVGWGADTLIIAGTLGAAYVAMFSVCHRLFQFISQPLTVVNSAFWPSYANAYACGDGQFIRATLKRTMLGSILIWAVIAIILIAFGQQIIAVWTDGIIVVSRSLLIAFSVWVLCEVIGIPLAMFLNGCSILRVQVYGAIALLLIGLPLKVYLAQKHGISAMLLGFTALYFLNIFFWFGLVFRGQVVSVLRGQSPERAPHV